MYNMVNQVFKWNLKMSIFCVAALPTNKDEYMSSSQFRLPDLSK